MAVSPHPGPRLIYLPDTEAQPLAESLVALANSDGGTIVLGLNEEGLPVEDVLEEDADAALREAAALCRPPVPAKWQAVQ